MKKLLLLTTVAMLAAVPAKADVTFEAKLSGTGDNVVFNSLVGDLALANLNGQHNEFVRFRDLSQSNTFTAAANGNDIKINGTQNLFIQVFDAADLNVVGTTTQVFSVTGDGDLNAFVGASLNGVDEPIQFFDLGQLKNGQNGFTFNAINGEVMTSLRLIDVGGTITEFEHFRIDVAPAALATPLPATAWLFGAGLGGMALLMRRKKKTATRAAA